MAVEVLENLAKFPHCILLTRVGQFYEVWLIEVIDVISIFTNIPQSYFDQATEVARLLDIKLTSRRWGGGAIAFCGFPLKHLNKHLKTLVQDQKRFVAMCEEFPKPRSPDSSKVCFERRVTRIVTPGTLIDEPFLNQFENNYLLAVSTASSTLNEGSDFVGELGLAWIDISTGEFFAKRIAAKHLRDELVRIGPKEIVLEQQLFHNPQHPLRQLISEERLFTSYISSTPPPSETLIVEQTGSDDLSSQTDPSAALLKIELSPEESQAVQLLTTFLHTNLIEHMPRLPSPSREAIAGRMQIDAYTIKSLEIREGIREGGTAGCLLSVIKRTVTSSGTRLLARWLCKFVPPLRVASLT